MISITWPYLIPGVIVAACFMLAMHPHVVDRLPAVVSTVNIAFLTATWSVEATIFALVVTLSGLLIAASADRLDRRRTMQRFRSQAFNMALFFGSLVILASGGRTLLSTPDSSGIVKDGAFEWIFVLLFLLIVDIGYLIWRAHELVAMTPHDKISWLKDEIRRSVEESHLRTRSKQALKRWLRERELNTTVTFCEDLGHANESASSASIRLRLHSPGYLHDISLSRLDAWLKSVQTLTACQVKLATLLDRRIREDTAVVQLDGSPVLDEKTVHRLEVELHRACDVRRRDPTESLEYSLKALRDQGCSAARNGQIADFEFVLETLKDVIIAAYPLKRARDAKTYLRAAVHELCEEVLQVRHPNIIKALLHAPQRLLQNTRSYSTRSVTAIMYPWFRAITFAAELEQIRYEESAHDLIVESLITRLHYYQQDLVRALEDATGNKDLRAEIEAEAKWLIVLLFRTYGVAGRGHRLWLKAMVNSMSECGAPQFREWAQAGAALAARDVVGIAMRGTKFQKQAQWLCELGTRLSKLAETYQTPVEVMRAWDIVNRKNQLIPNGSKVSDVDRSNEQFAELIDLTWEEQIEVSRGRLHGHRVMELDKAGPAAMKLLMLHAAGGCEALAGLDLTTKTFLWTCLHRSVDETAEVEAGLWAGLSPGCELSTCVRRAALGLLKDPCFRRMIL